MFENPYNTRVFDVFRLASFLSKRAKKKTSPMDWFFFLDSHTPPSDQALPPKAAESGSHSPLEDRQARLPGGERANIRAKREIPGTCAILPFCLAILPKVCYNKIRKVVQICCYLIMIFTIYIL